MDKDTRTQNIKKYFDDISPHFDAWTKILQERVYDYVTWEHLKKHLPEEKNALILDAGGGTGRWAIPLAKSGYNVVLCDVSEGMLKKAAENIEREHVSDKITLKSENLIALSFSDHVFDFVLCEDGPISISDSQAVMNELCRVLKPGCNLWACVLGRYPLALSRVGNNLPKALKLLRGDLNFITYKGLENSRVFSPNELRRLLAERGMEVIQIYGNRIITPLLASIQDFDDTLYNEIKDAELKLSEDPSLSGHGEYLQIVGKS